jgi:hypothetical protein
MIPEIKFAMVYAKTTSTLKLKKPVFLAIANAITIPVVASTAMMHASKIRLVT